MKYDLEEIMKFSGAQVVWADYSLLRKKLEFTPGSSANYFYSSRELEKILIDSIAYLTRPYFGENEVCDVIEKMDGSTHIRRPPNYGRAGVFSTPFGELDVKGIGVRDGVVPRLAPYETGLLELPEAIYELCVQRYIESNVYKNNKSTVSNLAVVLLPTIMNTIGKKSKKTYCALLVREYFDRFTHFHSLESVTQFLDHCLNVENLLREFNLTSCNQDEMFLCIQKSGNFTVRHHTNPKNFTQADEKVCEYLKSFVDFTWDSQEISVQKINLQFSFSPLEPHRLYITDFGGFSFINPSQQYLIASLNSTDATFIRGGFSNPVRRNEADSNIFSSFSSVVEESMCSPVEIRGMLKKYFDPEKVGGVDVYEMKRMAQAVIKVFQ